MKSPLIAALMAGAALSLTTAGAAFAQPPGPHPHGAAEKPHHDPAAKAQRLRDALQLTPAQEPALQAFIASMAQHKADRAQRRAEHQAMADMTTPQRLDRMAAHMAERQQRFAAHAEATRRFYAQLTPAQQKAFDAMHAKMGGKHRGMMMRHMGHGE